MCFSHSSASTPVFVPPTSVTLELTQAEVDNLRKFHAQRESASCGEAFLGYGVEQKLNGAALQFVEPGTDIAQFPAAF